MDSRDPTAPSPRHLLWWTALAIFGVETAIMVGFGFLPPLPALLEPMLDAAILIGVLLPLLHLTWERTLRRALDDQQRARTAMEARALQDALTQLPNRLAFETSAERELQGCQAAGTPLTLVVLDVRDFHEINDTLGQKHADALLRQLAERLRSSLPHHEAVTRLGPDVFGVMLRGVDRERAADAANRVHQVLEQPFAVADGLLHVDGHCGVAVFPEHGTDAATLLRRAELALRVAKGHGDRSRIFEQDLSGETSTHRRVKLFGLLRQALQNGELRLNYQPKVDGKTKTVVGAEALLSWRHGELGLISPAEFIPVAEQTNLIKPITAWVVEEAVRQIAAWRTQGAEIRVAVNLSARNLTDETLPDHVQAMLQRYEVPPGLLVAEVTESAVLADPGRTAVVLERLIKLGVMLSLDDFGTGYSSLTYLRTIPAGELKIDRSFVSDLDVSHNNKKIVRAIIDLAHDLGLKVVAEGVETEAIWRCLHEMGCDVIQGYLVSRPLTAEQFSVFVREHESDAAPAVALHVSVPHVLPTISLPPTTGLPRLRESLQSLRAVRLPTTRSDAPL